MAQCIKFTFLLEHSAAWLNLGLKTGRHWGRYQNTCHFCEGTEPLGQPGYFCLLYQAKSYLAEHLSAGVSRLPPVLGEALHMDWQDVVPALHALLGSGTALPPPVRCFTMPFVFSSSPSTGFQSARSLPRSRQPIHWWLIDLQPALTRFPTSHSGYQQLFLTSPQGCVCQLRFQRGLHALGIAIGFQLLTAGTLKMGNSEQCWRAFSLKISVH